MGCDSGAVTIILAETMHCSFPELKAQSAASTKEVGSAAESCTTGDFSTDQAAAPEVTQNSFRSWQGLCLGEV